MEGQLGSSGILRTTYDDDSLGGSHGHDGWASTLATAARLTGGNAEQGDSVAGGRLDGARLSHTGDMSLSLIGARGLSLRDG